MLCYIDLTIQEQFLSFGVSSHPLPHSVLCSEGSYLRKPNSWCCVEPPTGSSIQMGQSDLKRLWHKQHLDTGFCELAVSYCCLVVTAAALAGKGCWDMVLL